jgi:hypothetical protein
MYYIGVDVGQANDPSAIAVLEEYTRPRKKIAVPGTLQYELEPLIEENVYRAVHMERIPLGAPYAATVERVKLIVDHVKVAWNNVLLVDMTGIGRAVIEMMRDISLAPIGIQITAGRQVAQNEGGYNVPKLELVTTLQVLYQTYRIELPSSHPETKIIEDQLQNFTYSVNAGGHMSFGAEKDEVHDDLVIAMSLAAWYAEKSGSRKVVTAREHASRREEYDPLRRGML